MVSFEIRETLRAGFDPTHHQGFPARCPRCVPYNNWGSVDDSLSRLGADFMFSSSCILSNQY